MLKVFVDLIQINSSFVAQLHKCWQMLSRRWDVWDDPKVTVETQTWNTIISPQYLAIIKVSLCIYLHSIAVKIRFYCCESTLQQSSTLLGVNIRTVANSTELKTFHLILLRHLRVTKPFVFGMGSAWEQRRYGSNFHTRSVSPGDEAHVRSPRVHDRDNGLFSPGHGGGLLSLCPDVHHCW